MLQLVSPGVAWTAEDSVSRRVAGSRLKGSFHAEPDPDVPACWKEVAEGAVALDAVAWLALLQAACSDMNWCHKVLVWLFMHGGRLCVTARRSCLRRGG